MNTALELRSQTSEHPPDTNPTTAHRSGASILERWAVTAGLALLLWGRRHRDARLKREQAIARYHAERARRGRESARDREAALLIPRR